MKNKNFRKIIIPIIIGLCTSILTIPTFADHTHTDDCYAGTKHICVGNETEGGVCYQKAIYHTHIDACYETLCKTTNVEQTTTISEELCDYCQQPLSTITYTCSTCAATNETTGCHNDDCEKYVGNPTLTHKNLSIEQAKNQNITTCNKNSETIESYEKTCSKTNGNYYNSSNMEVTPMCSYIISKIEAVYKEQNNNSKIDKTIKITYMDGHTEIKTANMTDFNGDTTTTQTVNLMWTGIKDAFGNEGQFLDSINYYVEVTPTLETPTPTVVVTSIPTATPTMETQTEEITLRPTATPIPDKAEITTTQPTNGAVITPPIQEEPKNDSSHFLLIFIIIVIIIVLILAIITVASIVSTKDNDSDDDEYENDDYYDDYDDYEEYDEMNDEFVEQSTKPTKSSLTHSSNNDVPFVVNNDEYEEYIVPDIKDYLDD